MTHETPLAPYSATFPADPAAVARIRGDVAGFAARCGFSEVELYDIRIAVSEIATNAVLHAYGDGRPGEIRVQARYARGSLEVTVADDGTGMAPRLRSPGLGLGLPTAAGAAANLEIVTPEGGGTEVRLTFRRAPCADLCGAGAS